MDKLDYLIQYLLDEAEISSVNFPTEESDKKSLYRGLVNIREAEPVSEEFLKVEDEYLQGELKNITDVKNIQTISELYKDSHLQNTDKIGLWQGDITKLKIDAIVNATNSQGLGCFIPNHNCIDNQIQTFAGVRLRLECKEKMEQLNGNLETGKSIITMGYNLPAKNVIHTVGPIIGDKVSSIQENQLADCYQNSLELAIENGIRTIAFPCISTGVFHFPKDLACQIALKTVDEFLNQNRNKIDKIIFNLWSDEDVIIYEQYIKNNK